MKVNQTLKIGNFTYSIINGISEMDTTHSLYAKVSTILINPSTMEQTYEIEYMHAILKELNSITVPYSDLLPTGIISLMSKGLDVSNYNKHSLSNALFASIPYADVVFVVSTYGFTKFKNIQIFACSRVLSKTTLSDKIQVHHEKFDLTPKGSFDNWLQMYEKYIHGHTPLEFAVVLGLSAPIISYLNQSYPDLKSLLINFSGDSSIGKTTALSLAVSVAGEPNKGHKSLQRSWNGTENANQSVLEGVYGIPIAFDELSANRRTNLDSLLYTLTEGVGRTRSRNDGSLNSISTWATTILSSGELDIFNRLSENTGLKVRIYDLKDVPWTTSANQSEQIKASITENYGWLLPAFVEKIFCQNIDIESYFEEAVAALKKSNTLRITSERVFKKLAIITTTANLIKDLELLDINVKAIYNMVITFENEANNRRDIGKQAQDSLMQYLLANRNLISKGIGNKIGYIEGQTVCIYRDSLTKILKELGFEDARIIRKKWVESEIILPTETDRLTTRKVVGGERHISYRIAIPDEYVREGLSEYCSINRQDDSSSHSRSIDYLGSESLSNSNNIPIDLSESFELDDSDFDF